MNRILKIIFAFFAAVSVLSCTVGPAADDGPQPEIKEGYVSATFGISLVYSYAFLTEKLETGFVDGDKIAVYDGISPEPNEFVVFNSDGLSASIRGAVSEGAEKFAAVFPYSAAKGFSDEVLTVSVPSEQIIPQGSSFDPSALVFVGHVPEGGYLEMYNIVAPVKFQLSDEGTEYIRFVGNGSEPVVGDASVEPLTENVSPARSDTLFVRSASGSFDKGTYYAPIYPAAFYSGYSIRMRTDKDDAFVKTEIAVSFSRNTCLDTGDLFSKAVMITNPAMSARDLLSFAENAGQYGPGDVYALGADIDMSGAEWPNPDFHGIFDGGKHRVFNFVTANRSGLENVGFIGTLGNGTDPAVVRNLCVGSRDYDFSTGTGTYDGVSKITFGCLSGGTTTYKYPGLVSYAHNNTTLENVVNFISIEVTSSCTCRHRTGGVAGTMKKNVTMLDCSNFGSIRDDSALDGTATGLNAGGVSSCFDGEGCRIAGCSNHGSITVSSPHVVGVGGVLGTTKYIGEIKDCTNYGKVEYTGVPYTTCTVGGVIGQNGHMPEVSRCVNNGRVSCIVKGQHSSTVYLGGVLGRNYNCEATFDDCRNTGEVVVDPNGYKVGFNVEVGGIMAYDNSNGSIMNCSNSGSLTIKAGTSSGLIDFGGIVGRNVTSPITVVNCVNTGSLSNSLSTTKSSTSFESIAMGGLLGRSHQASTVKDCSCSARLSNKGSSPASQVGGLAGYTQSSLSVDNFSFTGTVSADEVSGGKASYYSGFIANHQNKKTPVNMCSIDTAINIEKAVKGATYAGGLFGLYRNDGESVTFEKTSVKCVITGAETAKAGILVGSVDASGKAVLTVGTAGTDPAVVSGSLNGSSASKGNLIGTGSASNSNYVFNVQL